MDCPRCGGNGIEGDFLTAHDSYSARSAASHGRRSPHAAGLWFAWGVGSYVAKRVLSKAYKCSKCKHVWRKWF